jgi:hypothetical protein
MSGIDDFVEDPQAPDEENARRFFGFSACEEFDAFTLRARKLKREDQAPTRRQREMIQRYFAILAPGVGIAVTVPASRQREEDDPTIADRPPAQPARPAIEAYVPEAPVQVRILLQQLRFHLDYALHTEVINHTIVAYNRLFATLVELARLLGVNPATVENQWVSVHLRTPEQAMVSRTQLEEVLELLPDGLHISLGGTPEYNHPSHRYITDAPEARLGLQFEYILKAIRDRARQLLANRPPDRWFVS